MLLRHQLWIRKIPGGRWVVPLSVCIWKRIAKGGEWRMPQHATSTYVAAAAAVIPWVRIMAIVLPSCQSGEWARRFARSPAVSRQQL